MCYSLNLQFDLIWLFCPILQIPRWETVGVVVCWRGADSDLEIPTIPPPHYSVDAVAACGSHLLLMEERGLGKENALCDS